MSSGDDAQIELGAGNTYVWDAPRPFVHPLRTPAGHVLSVDAPADHPWHHGLWFTIKFLDGDNYWEEFDDYGTLRHDGPPSFDADGWLRGHVDWVAPDGRTVAAVEDRMWRVQHLAEDSYALDLDTSLTTTRDSTLDRTPFTTWGGYGGLTLRGRPDWHDTVLTLPDGSAHDRILGTPAAWCALAGPIAGQGEAGVAFLDHPDNPNHPTPWYASTRAATYGEDGWSNFFNAAFLWDGPLRTTAGRPVRFRYRVIVFDGTIDTGWIEDQYRRYAA